MELSQEGLDRIKKLEGFSSSTYKDSAGKSTIGYGHLIKQKEVFTYLTEEEASDLLLKDVQVAVDAINDLVDRELTQNQFDALVLFVYNVGVAAFTSSTMLRLLQQGDFDNAANQFILWNKVHTPQGRFIEVAGLTARRTAERDLFLATA